MTSVFSADRRNTSVIEQIPWFPQKPDYYGETVLLVTVGVSQRTPGKDAILDLEIGERCQKPSDPVFSKS